MNTHVMQLLILAVRPLLFEAVKTATASICLHGQPRQFNMLHRHELDECAVAARQNIHLCRQTLQLRQPTTLSVSYIHYSFNAALSLELHRILVNEEVAADREQVAFVASILDAEEGGNRDYSKDCAKVLVELVSIIDRFRSPNFQIPDLASDEHAGRTAVQQVFSRNEMGTLEAWNALSSDAPTTKALERTLNGTSHPLPHERESAYTQLLSWLQQDNLQQPCYSDSGSAS
jgi:hypothetical protein